MFWQFFIKLLLADFLLVFAFSLAANRLRKAFNPPADTENEITVFRLGSGNVKDVAWPGTLLI